MYKKGLKDGTRCDQSTKLYKSFNRTYLKRLEKRPFNALKEREEVGKNSESTCSCSRLVSMNSQDSLARGNSKRKKQTKKAEGFKPCALNRPALYKRKSSYVHSASEKVYSALKGILKDPSVSGDIGTEPRRNQTKRISFAGIDDHERILPKKLLTVVLT